MGPSTTLLRSVSGSLCGEHRVFTVPPVREVNIGVGHGSSMGSAKRDASVQALGYLKSHGKGTSYSYRERR